MRKSLTTFGHLTRRRTFIRMDNSLVFYCIELKIESCHEVVPSGKIATKLSLREKLPRSGPFGKSCHEVVPSGKVATKWSLREKLPRSGPFGKS
jgi:hypothetical protein